jgi:hypothetical protein
MEKRVIRPEEVKYQYAGKESILQTLSTSIPKELFPTKKTGYVFGVIFLIVVVLALLRFPLGAMMEGKTNLSIDVGIPMTFLRFNLADPTEPPAKINGLIIDLLIYLILSYAIDVIINLILKSHLIESAEEKKKRPKVFKNKKQSKTIAEKVTDKIITKSQAPNPKR